MKAYDRGFQDGLSNSKDGRYRVYETDKAEKAYWEGYVAGMKHSNPGKRIVECTRDGKFFAVENINLCTCPTCGRTYINLESDRKLKVIV
jgi:hypothetical protein